MSEEQQMAPYQAAIKKSEERFKQIATGLRYDTESVFAMQQLIKNDFSLSTANKNPRSVQLAMHNCASTGLTLNPANGYAYLVPRDGQIVLDISYKGLIKIATDTGSIQWARAELVYSSDEFTYFGPAGAPSHKCDPFKKERGDIVGAYCIAKTNEGDILCEVMPMEELEKIRSKSSAFVKGYTGRKGPWEEWFNQMAKKAIIKRASKTWPYTEQAGRIEQAIAIANESEGGYDLETEEEHLHKRKQTHDAALGRHYQSVEAIKQALGTEDPDMHAVAEMWGEIPQDDQMALWLATTKGGIFTTFERNAIKTGLPKLNNEEEQ